MTDNRGRNRRWLWIILAYGVVITGIDLNYSSIFHDEAISVFMGRNALLNLACDDLCLQNTGSVLVQPVLVAMGDAIGGIYGVRAVTTVFGIGLALVMYFTGRILFSEKHGLISSMLFLFTGTVLYLSKLGTYDIIAAFFLGLSFLLILKSKEHRPRLAGNFLLVAAAVSLFLASITKYTASVYIVPVLFYVFWKHKFAKGVFCFLLPLIVFLLSYIYLAIPPAWKYLSGTMTSPYKEGLLPFMDITGRIFRWLGLPYLLAVFGTFSGERRVNAITCIVLSLPIVLLHIFTGDGRSVDKNVIFALVFLIPAMASGVDNMGSIFSTNIPSSWVRPFFTTAVLVVVWVFGINDLRWLEKQYPDMSQVINFYKQKGFNGMTVVIDSVYGEPDYIYRYSLEDKYPAARFISTSHITQKEQEDMLERVKPDFLMSEEFYGAKFFRAAALNHIERDYVFAKGFTIPLSWGPQEVQILKRR
jgi:hypothetical protein